MTVSSAVAKKLYSGNGVTTAFPTVFQFFDNTDIVVTEIVDATGVETVKTLTTHYTVSGGDGATGTVTMLTAPASGVTLVIEREVPYTQGTDYIANDSFPAEAHEQALDKLTMLTQQAVRDVRTSPALPLSFDPDNDVRPVLPIPEAGKLVMGTDDEGWENVTVADLSIAGIPVAIAAAAAGDVLMYNGTNWVDATTLTGNYTFSGTVGMPASTSANHAVRKSEMDAGDQQNIWGLTYANDGTDPTNDIVVAVGGAMDSTGTRWLPLASALTKRLDANWVVGNNQGGILSGAAANVDYNIWLIGRTDLTAFDIGFETTANATPTLPSGYTFYRKIGWFKRVAGAIVLFDTYQEAGGGLRFEWRTKTLDVELLNTLTTARRTDAPKVPLSFSTTALLRVLMGDNSAAFTALVCNPAETDAAPSLTVSPGANFFQAGTTDFPLREVQIVTSAAGLVAARATLATVDFYRIWTVGFIWSRR